MMGGGAGGDDTHHLVSLMEISVVKEFCYKQQTKDYLLKPSEGEIIISFSQTMPK